MAVRGGSNDVTLPTFTTETIGSDEAQVVRLDKGASTTRVPVTDADGLPVTLDAASLAALESVTASVAGPDVGSLTETAPATDTASSGLNGRLQRLAQRITSLIALLPASLGQKTKANSLAVTLASDQYVVVSATPTLDTSAYAAGDSLHTAVLTFANAAGLSGGTGVIYKTLVIDADKQSASGELWLFSATVTPAAANAAHSISDADAALCVGVIPFGPYYASALNSVGVNATTVLPFKCAATSLFGILVTRGAPTHTASGLVISLHIAQD